MAWQTVGPLADFPDGEAVGTRVGTQAIVVVRQGENARAVDALCPHKFGPLAEGSLENGCIVCPIHDAHFSVEDGTPRTGDEWAGQLPIHQARVVDGVIEVDL